MYVARTSDIMGPFPALAFRFEINKIFFPLTGKDSISWEASATEK